ncbi:MAG: hypothetical protein IME95_04110 [Proteobacteria bacterium]|nr:hypothetical protein [Pseudomonadota bacterium]
MVRHPGSTGIVPLFDDGTIAMVSQYRHTQKDSFDIAELLDVTKLLCLSACPVKCEAYFSGVWVCG